MSTWLITGCSTGLGRAFAEAALAHGHNSSPPPRNADTVQDFAEHGVSVLALSLDVTDPAQVAETVGAAEATV